MDINALFTQNGMRAFSAAQRDQHLEDARHYGQLSDIVRRRLEQTPVDGDRWLSARLRARKVARRIKAMERASAQAAAASEALYAAYVNQVLELPQRREQAAVRKAERKARRGLAAGNAGGLVAKSLGKSAAQLGGLNGTVPQAGAGEDARYLAPEPFPMAAGGQGQTSTQTIGDFFRKEGGR